MACNQCFCLACVRTNTVALVERCGKFQAIKGPGCQCLVWPVDSCVEINQCVGCYIATPSSRRRVDGVEHDAMIQHERAVKF